VAKKKKEKLEQDSESSRATIKDNTVWEYFVSGESKLWSRKGFHPYNTGHEEERKIVEGGEKVKATEKQVLFPEGGGGRGIND